MPRRDAVNRGVHVLRPPLPAGQPRTLIVSGVARSGTTMIVRMLHALGLFMGRQELWRRNCEARELSTPLEERDLPAFRRQLRDYEELHGSFGFKRPDVLQHHETIDACARSPHYVVTFRDLLAIGIRNQLSVQFDVQANLRDSWQRYGTILEFLERSTRPCLLLSYEKALQDPGYLAAQLADFAGLPVTETEIELAAQECLPGDPRYLTHQS